MKNYKVYASVVNIGECTALYNEPWVCAYVMANSLKEAFQIFYDSLYCQKFVEKNIVFNKIHFLFENKFGKLCYYGSIEL